MREPESLEPKRSFDMITRSGPLEAYGPVIRARVWQDGGLKVSSDVNGVVGEEKAI